MYLIVFAMIVFIASCYYIRERKNKYLWWFTVGLVLMFATMEVVVHLRGISSAVCMVAPAGPHHRSSWLGDAAPLADAALGGAVGLFVEPVMARTG